MLVPVLDNKVLVTLSPVLVDRGFQMDSVAEMMADLHLVIESLVPDMEVRKSQIFPVAEALLALQVLVVMVLLALQILIAGLLMVVYHVHVVFLVLHNHSRIVL
ncbi:hypothetical protein ACO02O_00927 [Dirofilaria immitis]